MFHYPKFDQTNDSCLLNSLDHQRLGLADPAFGLLAKKIKQKIKQKISGPTQRDGPDFLLVRLPFYSVCLYLFVHNILLNDRQDIVDKPVKDQTGGKEDKHNTEDKRHNGHHFRLDRIRRCGVQLELNDHRDDHKNRKNEPRIRGCQVSNPEDPGSISQFNRGQKHPVQS